MNPIASLEKKIVLEEKEKQLLDEITRDIVTIVASVISVIAFGFAIWATVETIRQANLILATEIQSSERIEKVELQILEKLNRIEQKINLYF